MPPKITRVKWDADNVPWGVVFDELTGTFTGKPEEVGEYVIPVTVETNYGTDTKDIKLIIERPVAVYKFKHKPKTSVRAKVGWTGRKNGGIPDPDGDGFYPINYTGETPRKEAPNLVALSDNPYGFIGYTQSGQRYGVGLVSIQGVGGNAVGLAYNLQGVIAMIDNIKGRTAVYTAPGNSYPISHKVYSCATMTADRRMTLGHILRYTVQVGSGSERVNSYFKAVTGVTISDLPVLDIGVHPDKKNGYGIRWLSEDGTQDCYIQYTVNNSAHTAYAKLVTQDLGYKAVKLISPAPFSFLSEDMLLDNNPDNFPYGTIKDVYGYDTLMYVQTTDNKVYEYNSATSNWTFLGSYDVKKIEVPAMKDEFFMLTNDGRLYHRGNSISGLVDAHRNTLTPVYTSRKFVDFTYDYERGILMVLEE